MELLPRLKKKSANKRRNIYFREQVIEWEEISISLDFVNFELLDDMHHRYIFRYIFLLQIGKLDLTRQI